MQFTKIIYLLNKKQKKNLIFLLLFMILGALLETFSIGLVLPALTLALDAERFNEFAVLTTLADVMNWSERSERITGVMIIILLIYIIKTAFLIFLAWMQAGFAQGVRAEVSQKLFSTYFYQPYIFHLGRNSAQLIRNLTTEVRQFMAALLHLLTLIAELFMVSGLVILLLLIEPVGTLVTSSVLLIVGVSYHRVTRSFSQQWGERRQYHEGMMVQRIQEGLGGIKEAILAAKEESFLAQYSIHNYGSARVGRYQNILNATPRLMLELIAILGLSLFVMTLVARDMTVNEFIPVVGVFVVAAVRLMPSMNRILVSLQGLRYSVSAIFLLSEELKQLSVDGNTGECNAGDLKIIKNIELEDVSYVYPGTNRKVLNNVSLRILRGETIGIIGGTGEGKSTLVDLLIGLLTPTSGRVLVNDLEVGTCRRSWQSNIGYVPQHIFLVDSTLRKNIAFGLSDDEIDEDRVSNAVRLAQLESFVASLPEGLSAHVGERGLKLSGGQRQRIGIARALYNDPDVLVFDESTSALDIRTESEVIDSIVNIQESKTVIMITHRLATLKSCEKIYEISNGSIHLQSQSLN